MAERLIGGRYRLGDRIGTGGMGHVWQAWDGVLRRRVAIKEVILPDGLDEAELSELRIRTLREARAAARLDHPNVVRVYDVIYADDRPWIVMEFVPSKSLAQTVREIGPLTPERTARIGLVLLHALRAAHAAGVLHRDVKPGNVLLAHDGRVVLTDFGLATFDEAGASLTASGVIHGSPQFIAPERALDGTSTPQADMWSLGATLYAAVEGHGPYSRSTSYATLTALATRDPDPPVRAGRLAPVILGLLRRDPGGRMHPDEVRERLARIAAADAGRGWFIRRPRRAASAPVPGTDHSGGSARTAPVPEPPTVRTPVAMSAPAAFSEPAASRPGSGPLDDGLGDYYEPISLGLGGHSGSRYTFSRRFRAAARGRRLWGPVVFLALIGVVLGAVLWRYPMSDASQAKQQPVATPSQPGELPRRPPFPGGLPPAQLSWQCVPTPPVRTTTMPSNAPVATPTGPEPGWVMFRGDTGFRVAVPSTWRMSRDDGNACFYNLDTQWVFGVDDARMNATTAVQALTMRESEMLTADGLPRYQRLGIDAVDCSGQCATWEYTYQGPFGMLHARTWAMLAPSGMLYALTWETPETTWVSAQPDYRYTVASFAEPKT